MITVRPAAERGHADHGWLQSRHTFSFAHYRDPAHMGFGPLRVINDDHVAPSRGFGEHPHRDMEIISVVVSGELAHRDSMGNGSIIRPGEVQLMSAGTGVVHSEMNPSPDTPVNFLQIWVVPSSRGGAPGYQQKDFGHGPGLTLVVSPDGRDGSLTVKQDAALYRGELAAGQRLTHAIAPGRRAWVQLISGALHVDDVALTPGDGAAITDAQTLQLGATDDALFLLFDLP